MKSLAIIGAVSVIAACADARRVHVETTADGRKTERPQIELGVDEDLCIFKNLDDWWCLEGTPPMIEIGMEWKQLYAPTDAVTDLSYYQLEWDLYHQTQANIISNLWIQNIWVNVITFDIDQFKQNLYVSLIVNENLEICTGFGYARERIVLNITWAMRMWNCSKVVLNDLADYSSTWTGVDSTYFDKPCTLSNNAEIILAQKEFRPASNTLTWGTLDAKSLKCLALFGSSRAAASRNDPATFLTKMGFKRFFSWMVQTYPDSFNMKF